MTVQEAKNIVAKKHDYQNWEDFVESTSDYDEVIDAVDEVAKVYAKKLLAKNNEWFSVEDKPPTNDLCAVIGFSEDWIDPDFNPDGVRECFLNGDGKYTSAKWCNNQDSYYTDEDTIPTHWRYYPRNPLS